MASPPPRRPCSRSPRAPSRRSTTWRTHCNEPELVAEPNCAADDNGGLALKLIVVILDDNQATYLGSRVLDSWAGTTLNLGQLAPGASKTVYLGTQVDPTADNRVQSDSAPFVVNAALAQLP